VHTTKTQLVYDARLCVDSVLEKSGVTLPHAISNCGFACFPTTPHCRKCLHDSFNGLSHKLVLKCPQKLKQGHKVLELFLKIRRRLNVWNFATANQMSDGSSLKVGCNH